jgi:hypothetical protein
MNLIAEAKKITMNNLFSKLPIELEHKEIRPEGIKKVEIKKVEIKEEKPEVLTGPKVVKLSEGRSYGGVDWLPWSPSLDPLMRQFEEALAKGDSAMVALIREQIEHFQEVRR